MISGASDKELTIANAKADIIGSLDNTSTYESWLVLDSYIEGLEQSLNEIRKVCYESDMSKQEYDGVSKIIDKVLGEEK